jgi:hypothetical protein
MDKSALQQIREADLHARSAELVIDRQSLLIAHIHIHSVEPILDVRIESGHGQALGVLELGDDRWPVYCLDGNLNILAGVPATRRACVLLKSEHGGVGVLCDEVRVVDNASLVMVPVPGCMSGEQSLMDSLAVIDGKVTCVLGADRLSAMLRSGVDDEDLDTHALPVGVG